VHPVGFTIALSIIYFECMSVALGIGHAMRMRHVVFCGLSDSTILFHTTSQTAR